MTLIHRLSRCKTTNKTKECIAHDVNYNPILNNGDINDSQEEVIVKKIYNSDCYELYAERNKLFDRKKQLQTLIATSIQNSDIQKMYQSILDEVNREIEIYKQILLKKNVIDSEGNVIVHEDNNLNKNDECFYLKKLLKHSKNNCSMKNEFDTQGRFGYVCNNSSNQNSSCQTYDFDCNVTNNSNMSLNIPKSYCTPNDINDDSLTLDQRKINF